MYTFSTQRLTLNVLLNCLFRHVKVIEGLTIDFGTLFVLNGYLSDYKFIRVFYFGGSSTYVTGVKNLL